MARPKIRKWLRRLAKVAAAVVVLVVLALVFKVPERLVGFVLGRVLGATVSIEDLDFHSLRTVTAQGIVVQGLPGGSLDGLKSGAADVVEVEGSLGRALRGEIDRVQIAGARGVLLLPSPLLEQEGEESSLLIHSLAAEGVQILFEPADGSVPSGPFTLSADLREVGGEMGGQAEMHAEAASLDPLLRFFLETEGQEPEGQEPEEDGATTLAGDLRELRATVRLDPQTGVRAEGTLGALHLERGGATTTRLDVESLRFEGSQDPLGRATALLEAAAARALAPSGEKLRLTKLQAKGSFEENAADLRLASQAAVLQTANDGVHTLPPPSIEARGRQLDDGAWQVEIVPELAFLDKASGRIVWHPEETLPRQIEAEVKGLHLAALSAWIPGLTGGDLDGLEVTGLADLEVWTLPGDENGPRLRYSLAANLPHIVLPAKLDAQIPGPPGPRTLSEVDAELSGDLALATPRSGGPIEASFSVGGGTLPEGILPVRGQFSGRVGAEPQLAIEGSFAATTARVGRLEAKGSLATGPWEWKWKDARLASVVAVLRTLDVGLPEDLVVDGSVGAAGTLSLANTPKIEGSFQWDEGAAQGTEPLAWSLADLEGSGRFHWMGDRLWLSNLHLQSAVEVAPLGSAPFTIEATAEVNTATGAGQLSALTFDAGDLGVLEVAGTVSPEGRLRSNLEVVGSQLGALRNFLRPLTGELASGLAMQGSAGAQLELTAANGTWNLEGPAQVQGSGFSSEDGSRVLEGFESQWQIQLVGSTSKEEPTHLVATAKVTGFQLLWGLFYGDFSGLQSTLSLDGTLEPLPEGDEVTFPPWHVNVAWTVPEGPSLALRLDRDMATAEQADLRYSLALRLEDLERSYGRYLRGPLTDSSPRFAQVRLAGDLGAHLEGAFLVSGGTTMTGQLLAEGLVVEGIEGQMAVRDLDLDLPVDLAWNADGKLRRQLAGIETPERLGAVRFERADLQGFQVPPLRSVLRVRGDAVNVEEAVSVPLAGGRIAFQGLTLVDLLTAERFAETALRIEALDLEKLAAGLGLPPLDGSIDGRLPRVRLDATTLQVDGGGEISLFGGTVRVGDISGENVLSRFPKVTFSAEFQEVDIGRLTRRFDVGVMNGVLQGSVTDCELFRWVPVRCTGQFETVQRRGVRRNISVKAINNIAILGTGQGLGFLDKGIRSFFDKYTYSRLGIAMTLENDVFLLRGLEHRGDRELFLRGRLPFPIDVVNAQPGRTVSFQTMLRRLQTLDFSKATSSPTGGS